VGSHVTVGKGLLWVKNGWKKSCTLAPRSLLIAVQNNFLGGIMAITLAYAKRWCTKPEWDVIGMSFKENYKRLSEARLKEKIKLTRRMRDKFRDLAKHQKGEMRGKRKVRGQTPTVDSHLNDKKAKLFNEALERYQEYLADLGPATSGAASSKSVSKTKAKAKTRGTTGSKTASKTKSKVRKKKSAAKKTSSKATKVAKKKRRTRSERLERREELRKKFAEKKKKEAAAQKKKKQVQKKAAKSQASTANSKGSRKAATFQRNRSKVIQTHIKSSGKRNQAKRDAN